MIHTHVSGGHSITVETESDLTVTDDSGLIIHGPATVSYVQKNRPGSSTDDVVMGTHTLQPGDAGISFRQMNAGEARPGFWNGVEGRSVNADAIACVSVPWPKQSEEVMRPPVIGSASNPIVAFFRSLPILKSNVDISKLPSEIDLPPEYDVEKTIKRFEKFSGDVFSYWSTDTRTPDLQHQGYGSYYASDVSDALVALCSKIGFDQKMRLAVAMVQRGLDLAAAFIDGRENWMVDGGHMFGRTPLVILCGYLLNSQNIMNPAAFVGTNLLERHACYQGQPATFWGGNYGWKKHWVDANWMFKDPSRWTDYEKWATKGYLPHVMGAAVGTVLAFKMMGLEHNLGDAFCGMVTNWMDGIEEHHNQNLIQNGVNLPWGEDYTVFGIRGMCSNSWNAYFQKTA